MYKRLQRMRKVKWFSFRWGGEVSREVELCAPSTNTVLWLGPLSRVGHKSHIACSSGQAQGVIPLSRVGNTVTLPSLGQNAGDLCCCFPGVDTVSI